MDIDYDHIKDVENLRRESWVNSTPLQTQKPEPSRELPAQAPHNLQTPPVKPRRSLKLRKTPHEKVGQAQPPGNDQTNQTVVMRMSPALTLGPLKSLSPSLRSQTLLWFERTQLSRLSQPGHRLPCWLHGFTTRREAEELLKGKPQGCFLLRLSESKIGFVLSYRGKDRCRHFIVEEEEGGGNYLIVGEESRHGSLQELVSYYIQNPVGPFDEMLTIPCPQASGVLDNAGKLEDKSGRDGTNSCEGETSPLSPSSCDVPESVPEPVPEPPTTSAPADKDGTPEYAVVRKVLKKTRSIPEDQQGELSSMEEEPGISNLFTQDDSAKTDNNSAVYKNDNQSVDAQYARINKPPKATWQENTSPYVNVSAVLHQQGATEPHIPLTRRGSAGDPGYWKMEPLHTYEETPYESQQEQESQEQIDFYAMGRWQDVKGNAAYSENHLYSEVNVKGSGRGPGRVPPLGKAAPSLPSRPPPMGMYCPSQLDGDTQQGVDPLMSSRHAAFLPPHSQRPLTDDPGTSIYEQIPERPAGSRLPPTAT